MEGEKRNLMQVLTTKITSVKIAHMVGTFLNEDSTGSLFKREIRYTYQQVVSENGKLATAKEASQKVASTVATFLNESSDGSQIIKVTTALVVQ